VHRLAEPLEKLLKPLGPGLFQRALHTAQPTTGGGCSHARRLYHGALRAGVGGRMSGVTTLPTALGLV
jgi:hypothetical protein